MELMPGCDKDPVIEMTYLEPDTGTSPDVSIPMTQPTTVTVSQWS